MLICPQCSFENPDQNHFCQQCGYALQLWCACVIPRQVSAKGDLDNPASRESPSAPPTLRGLFPDYPYLDPQHRYQLQDRQSDPLVSESTAVAVIDCQPTAGSPLTDLQSQLLDNPQQDPLALAAVASLPPEAIPYLALQSQFFPTVPLLHDAWEGPTYATLLLENRRPWSLLADMWRLGAVDPLQQLHWFYKMAELWEALEPWQARSSLLESSNLRVDEDQILCLAFLQSDPPQVASDLASLGQFWQNLIEPVQETIPPELGTLIGHLATGKIGSVLELQTQLVQLADVFQAGPEGVLEPDQAPDLVSARGGGEGGRVGGYGADESGLDDAIASVHDDLPPITALTPASAPPEIATPETPADLPSLPEDPAFDEDTASIDSLEDSEENLDLPTMVLPMKIVRLDEAGRTHVGRQRDHNEDFFSAQTELTKLEGPLGSTLLVRGLYILCDGMGGHASGEVASSLAVKTLQNHFVKSPCDALPDEAALVEAVIAANEAIYEINQSDARVGHSRMGTTLVMLMLHNDRAVVAHVGDSRLYSYTRRAGLKQVTTDHEVGQREIQRGVEPAIAYARPDAYQLTQALGPRSRADLRPGINFIDIAEDTLFILCSDGLSDNDLLEQYCTSHIEPLLHSQADLEEGASKLIELANEYNGHDNITTILLRVKLKPNMDRLQLS